MYAESPLPPPGSVGKYIPEELSFPVDGVIAPLTVKLPPTVVALQPVAN